MKRNEKKDCLSNVLNAVFNLNMLSTWKENDDVTQRKLRRKSQIWE